MFTCYLRGFQEGSPRGQAKEHLMVLVSTVISKSAWLHEQNTAFLVNMAHTKEFVASANIYHLTLAGYPNYNHCIFTCMLVSGGMGIVIKPASKALSASQGTALQHVAYCQTLQYSPVSALTESIAHFC